jgi:hypothetical protein
MESELSLTRVGVLGRGIGADEYRENLTDWGDR